MSQESCASANMSNVMRPCPTDLAFHRREDERLTTELASARQEASLPDALIARAELDDLLVCLRMAYADH